MGEIPGYNPEAGAETNLLKHMILDRFEQAGIIASESGRQIFDIEKIKKLNIAELTKSTHIDSRDIINTLADLKGYPKEKTRGGPDEFAELEPRELLPLPVDRQELLTTYPQRAEQGLLKSWEIGGWVQWDNPISLSSDETVTRKELKIAATIPLDQVQNKLESDQGREKLFLITRMIDSGIVENRGGKLVFDIEAIKDYAKGMTNRGKINSRQVIEALSSVSGYKKDEIESEKFKEGELSPRPVVTFPKSLHELTTAYPERSKQALYQLDEISGRTSWIAPIELSSGERTNRAEIIIAQKLSSDLRAKRDQKGVLQIWDGEKHIKFSTTRFAKLTGLNPKVRDEQQRLKAFSHLGIEFVRRYAPNLIRLGIFQPRDFKIHGATSTGEVFNVNERRFNPKAPYVTFASGPNRTARYYMGREKLVGTKEPIDPERMNVLLLDPKTAGIVESRHGKKVLSHIFELLSSEEIAERQKPLLDRGMSQMQVDQNLTINAAEMKKRIHKYQITDFVPQHSGESTEQYAERVSRLSDIEFVTETFQNFFTEAGVGVHKLPWSEQLVLADAITEERDKDRLINFAKKYGINGVRSFLSMDFERKSGQRLLELGERGDPKIISEIFNKYSLIVDSVKKVESSSLQTFGKQLDATEFNKIRENLLRKAKELLDGFEPSKIDSLEAVNAIGQLEHINEEVMLFASTFKIASEKQPVDLIELKATEVSIKDSSQLTDKEKEQMLQIYKGNRVKYEPKRLAQTVREFEEVLSGQSKEFDLLTHNGEMIAFIRFDKQPNGNLYAGSLNVRPEARSSQIGMALLRATLDKKAETHNIEAVAHSKLPMLKHYTEDFGFEITGELPNYHGQEMYYQLFRPKQSRKSRPEAA